MSTKQSFFILKEVIVLDFRNDQICTDIFDFFQAFMYREIKVFLLGWTKSADLLDTSPERKCEPSEQKIHLTC